MRAVRINNDALRCGFGVLVYSAWGLIVRSQVHFSSPEPFAQNLYRPQPFISPFLDEEGVDLLLLSPLDGRSVAFRIAGDTVTAARELVLSSYDRESVAVADMNGDNRPDLLAGERRYENGESVCELAVYMNLGNGNLAPRIAVRIEAGNSTPACPDAPMAFGDLNGDGVNEVVFRRPWTYSSISNSLVDISNGQIDLGYPTNSVVCHDLNDDGLDEIIFGGRFTPYGFVAYWNMANGTPERHTLAAGQSDVISIQLADINADGLVDVLFRGGNSIVHRVIFQTALMSFSAGPEIWVPLPLPLPMPLYEGRFVDYDADGRMELWCKSDHDIIRAEIDPEDMGVQLDTMFSSTDAIDHFCLVESNGDDVLDLMVSTGLGNCLIINGQPDHTFGEGVHVLYQWAVTVGEHVCAISQPGTTKQLPLLLSDGYACHLGDEARRFVPPKRFHYDTSEGDYASWNSCSGLIEADLDGDQSPDLIRVGSGDDCILSIIENWKEAGATETCVCASPNDFNQSRSTSVIDINDDGLLDLVASGSAAEWSGTPVYVPYHVTLIREPDHTFTTNVTTLPASFFEFHADLDYDGRVDLIVPDSTTNTISVYRNMGLGQFEMSGSFPYDPGVYGIPTYEYTGLPSYRGPHRSFPFIDMDGDGRLDMLRFLRSSSGIDIFFQPIEIQSLSEPTHWTHLPGPAGYTFVHEAVFMDVDYDLDMDLIVHNSSMLRAYVNDGALPISAYTTIYLDENISDIVPMDANGDGREDLLLYNGRNRYHVIYNETPRPLATEGHFRLLPNPCAGLLYIDLGYAPTSAVGMDLIDPTGRLVGQFSVSSTISTYDLSNMPTGMYVLRAFDENEARLVGAERFLLTRE